MLIRPEDWRPQGVDDLEDRAWQALRTVERSVCVTAGAGAGKTEFLAQKATYLLQTGICPAPKRILAISFKRDAARTLADRVAKRCPADQGRRFVSMTFDAFTKGLVDQFRNALPDQYRPPANYQIAFPNKRILDDFLQRAEAPHVASSKLEKWMSARRILDEGQIVAAEIDRILNAYWDDQYNGGAQPFLTFAMINRLAEFLLRTNHRVRDSLRATYPFIFLDEFQDTTSAQFEIVNMAFDPDRASLTAVGDDKQRIMGWAGALTNAFEVFQQRYNALPVSLLMNWRSHDDLVELQHRIASRINPQVERVQARAARAVDGDVCAIWDFAAQEDEVVTIARCIADEVAAGRVEPHDVAILTRNYADRVEGELNEAFSDAGLIIRNLARSVGDISIQDLLSEELTGILLPFLRLGSSRRNPEAWAAAQENLVRLEALSDEDELGLQKAGQRTEAIARTIRHFMDAHDPEPEQAVGLVSVLIDEIGEARIRQTSASYQRQVDFDRVREGFEILLSETLEQADGWARALDLFEGRAQVPIMTIHKSKGMEFHTMIFFGLDARSWWSLTPDKDEELNSFFVAFTRAKQRAFFSSCRARGGQIRWLEELLGPQVPRVAGVDVVD